MTKQSMDHLPFPPVKEGRGYDWDFITVALLFGIIFVLLLIWEVFVHDPAPAVIECPPVAMVETVGEEIPVINHFVEVNKIALVSEAQADDGYSYGEFPEPETLELVDKVTAESLGEFYITVYTPHCDGGRWGYQTATGATSQHLATCAVDPKVIPLGSTIEVGGLQLVAVDTGSSVKGNTIDIFFDGSQAEARKWIAGFGTRHEAWIVY